MRYLPLPLLLSACLLAGILVSGAIFAGCASTGTVHGPQVIEHYDSVSGVTAFATGPIVVRSAQIGDNTTIYLLGVAGCPGRGQCGDPGYSLAIRMEKGRVHVGDDVYRLQVRVGEERYALQPEHLQSSDGGLLGNRSELVYRVEPEQFRRLAFSEDVEGRLGGYDLDLSTRRRESLRLLWGRLNPAEI